MMSVRPPSRLVEVKFDIASESSFVSAEYRSPEIGARALVPYAREDDFVPVSLAVHDIRE